MPQNSVQWACVVVMVAAVYLGFIRNNQVLNFKRRLIDKVSAYQKDHIKHKHSLDWEAYGLYDQVGYHKLVLMFWKPMGSFVPDELKKKLNIK